MNDRTERRILFDTIWTRIIMRITRAVIEMDFLDSGKQPHLISGMRPLKREIWSVNIPHIETGSKASTSVPRGISHFHVLGCKRYDEILR